MWEEEGGVVLEAIIMWEDRITTDSAVLVGKPVIKGTRLSDENMPGDAVAMLRSRGHDDDAASRDPATTATLKRQMAPLRPTECPDTKKRL